MVEFIRLEGFPEEAAQSAYDAGHFVEAIQILHGWMENQAQSLLMLVGAVHFDAKQSDTWDLTDTIGFSTCAKVLFILNQITKPEYDDLTELNQMRNKITHNLCKEPYKFVYEGVPKSDYDKVFKRTLEQIYLLTCKCGQIIE